MIKNPWDSFRIQNISAATRGVRRQSKPAIRVVLGSLKPVLTLLSLLLLTGCEAATETTPSGSTDPAASANQPSRTSDVLRLAVTTSTRDTGLLDKLLPVFEAEHKVRVDVIAAGTGKALRLGEAGEVDAVLVHARAAEDEFMAAKHGLRREDVMFNSFEILGPPADPAGIRGLPPHEALRKIATSRSRFVSRGDDSGTHQRERQLWSAGGQRPEWDGYAESGQGMGPTLTMADQMQAYVLADRGTFLAMQKKIDLQPLVPQTEALRNPYGILVVNPRGKKHINEPLAQRLVEFFVATSTQNMIRDFQVEGESLFYPAHSTAGE